METVKIRSGQFYLVLLILAFSVALLEYGGLVPNRGALLVSLVFWATLVQGGVAVVATTELIDARWIASLKKELLCCCPLLLLVLALFLLLLPQLEIYPWVEHPGRWLNEPFFAGRNLVLLVLCYLVARRFALHSLRKSDRRKTYAVIYLFLFVTSQSLVAFDWVMSLEYPWYSTLFGAYFFVEALYAGFAMAGLALLFFYPVKRREDPTRAERHLRDVGLLVFGFSVLWVGLFFAQFLLLWYGNLPEEVGFILERTSASPYREMGWLFLGANFLVPFAILISRRAKQNVWVVGAVSLVVLAGLFVERLLFILPVVPLHTGSLLFQNVLIVATWLLLLQSKERLWLARE